MHDDLELPRKGQPPTNDTLLDPFPIAFSTSEKKTTSLEGQSGLSQSVPFTCVGMNIIIIFS